MDENEQLRVIGVLPSLESGGSERVLLTLLARLNPCRYDRHIIILEHLGPFSDLIPEDVTVHLMGHRKLRNAFPAVLRTMRRLKPDIIFSTFGYLNLAVLAMRPILGRCPKIVIREPNTPSRSLPHLANATLLRAGYRLLYDYADFVICQSRLIGTELTRDFGVTPSHIVHLPNPVDVDAIRQAAETPERRPGPGHRFVAAGQLSHQKGFDRLIKLMSLVPPTCHLTIFGEGSERPNLAKHVDALALEERVRLAGYSPTPWPSFAGADALLLPSRWEGVPNVALEALACGTPVIGTPEAGGLAEVAAQAAPGAVTIASAGDEFLKAMRAIGTRLELSLRPSLLPSHHEADKVSARFSELLEL